jgi:hypothetical protein
MHAKHCHYYRSAPRCALVVAATDPYGALPALLLCCHAVDDRSMHANPACQVHPFKIHPPHRIGER